MKRWFCLHCPTEELFVVDGEQLDAVEVLSGDDKSVGVDVIFEWAE